MPDSTSPLDDAVAAVEREELAAAPKSEPGEQDPFTPPPTQTEPPKKRGRPVNPNSRRARAGAYAGNGSAQSGPVNDPPVVEKPERKVYPKIPVEAVAETIRRIDERIVAALGTAPLTPEEVKGGGEAFAPVLDHYMPLLTEQGGIWMAPLTFILLAYGPRAWEKLEDRQREKKRGLVAGAQSGENGKGDFSKQGARTLSVVEK